MPNRYVVLVTEMSEEDADRTVAMADLVLNAADATGAMVNQLPAHELVACWATDLRPLEPS